MKFDWDDFYNTGGARGGGDGRGFLLFGLLLAVVVLFLVL